MWHVTLYANTHYLKIMSVSFTVNTTGITLSWHVFHPYYLSFRITSLLSFQYNISLRGQPTLHLTMKVQTLGELRMCGTTN